MKYTKFLLPSFVCMAAAVSLSSCDNDDLHIGGLDVDGLLGSDGNVVYVTDALGSSETPRQRKVSMATALLHSITMRMS